MIPKIIHYCWLSDDPIPENLQTYMKSWKEVLVDYEFVKWDFSKFNKGSSKWVSDAFDNKKYAFAADYIRLYAIYNMGGIYLDMDVEVLKPFDDLLNEPYMLAYENEKRRGIEAGIFGAQQGSEFIKACLDSYNGKNFIREDGTFDLTPLPQIMQGVLDSFPEKLNLYDCLYFTAKSFETGEEFPNESTYTVHHFAGSWKTDKERKLIEETQRLSKKYGGFIGRNLAEYRFTKEEKGIRAIFKLTLKKIKRRFKKKR